MDCANQKLSQVQFQVLDKSVANVAAECVSNSRSITTGRLIENGWEMLHLCCIVGLCVNAALFKDFSELHLVLKPC